MGSRLWCETSYGQQQVTSLGLDHRARFVPCPATIGHLYDGYNDAVLCMDRAQHDVQVTPQIEFVNDSLPL